MTFNVTSVEQLGPTLKGLRRARHMTQAELAESAGLLQKTVSLLETAPGRCTVASLFRYLSALGIPVPLGLGKTTPSSSHKHSW